MRQKALLIDADDAASIPSPPAIRPDRIVAFLNLEAACRSEIIERVEAIGPDEVVLCDLYPEAVDLALLAWRQEYESRFDCELATKDEALKYAFAKDVFPDGWNWRAALDGPGMTTMSWPGAPLGKPLDPEVLIGALAGTDCARFYSKRQSKAPSDPWWKRYAEVAETNTNSAAVRIAFPLGVNPGPDGCAFRELMRSVFSGARNTPPQLPWKMPVNPPDPYDTPKARPLRAAPGALQIGLQGGGFDWMRSTDHCPAVLNTILRALPRPLKAPRGTLPRDLTQPTLGVPACAIVGSRVLVQLELRGVEFCTSVKGLSLNAFPSREWMHGVEDLKWSIKAAGSALRRESQPQFQRILRAFLQKLRAGPLGNWTEAEARLVPRQDDRGRGLHWFASFLECGATVKLTELDSLRPDFPVRSGLIETTGSLEQLIGVISDAATRSYTSTSSLPLELEVSEIISPLVYRVKMPGSTGERT